MSCVLLDDCIGVCKKLKLSGISAAISFLTAHSSTVGFSYGAEYFSVSLRCTQRVCFLRSSNGMSVNHSIDDVWISGRSSHIIISCNKMTLSRIAIHFLMFKEVCLTGKLPSALIRIRDGAGFLEFAQLHWYVILASRNMSGVSLHCAENIGFLRHMNIAALIKNNAYFVQREGWSRVSVDRQKHACRWSSFSIWLRVLVRILILIYEAMCWLAQYSCEQNFHALIPTRVCKHRILVQSSGSRRSLNFLRTVVLSWYSESLSQKGPICGVVIFVYLLHVTWIVP
jgi:hypothetical protein